MHISRTNLTIVGLLLLTMSIGFMFRAPDSSPIVITSTSSGLVSDLASPFGSGDSGKILFDATPTQPTWETSSGTTVFFNTNWIGRTIEIQGKPVHYQFSSGNPVETDKSVEELVQLNKRCRTNPVCGNNELSQYESVGDISNDDGTWKSFDPIPRITPEVERLVYEFLSNPVIRQSSESCGNKFFTYDQAYSVFGSIIGETIPTDWWNPYNIDINTYITINPNTGRKELNTKPIHTLKQQLNTPSELAGGTWWSNIPLRECLEKNNQLTFLLNHVNLYTDKIQQEYHAGK